MKKEFEIPEYDKKHAELTPMEQALKNIQLTRLRFELMLEIQSFVDVLLSEESTQIEKSAAAYALEAIADANELYYGISA